MLLIGAKDKTCHGEGVAAGSHWSRCGKSSHGLTSGKYSNLLCCCDIWKIRDKVKQYDFLEVKSKLANIRTALGNGEDAFSS